MSIIDSAWELQYRIEDRISKLPELSLSTYLQFISIVFIICGLGMFMYCMLSNVNPFELQVLSSPIFYLVEGFVLIGLYYIVKN